MKWDKSTTKWDKSTTYCTISMIFLTIFVVLISPTGEIKKGNCYDEKDNKINDLVCDIPVGVVDNLKYGSAIAFLTILGFMFFLGKLLIGIFKD